MKKLILPLLLIALVSANVAFGTTSSETAKVGSGISGLYADDVSSWEVISKDVQSTRIFNPASATSSNSSKSIATSIFEALPSMSEEIPPANTAKLNGQWITPTYAENVENPQFNDGYYVFRTKFNVTDITQAYFNTTLQVLGSLVGVYLDANPLYDIFSGSYDAIQVQKTPVQNNGINEVSFTKTFNNVNDLGEHFLTFIVASHASHNTGLTYNWGSQNDFGISLAGLSNKPTEPGPGPGPGPDKPIEPGDPTGGGKEVTDPTATPEPTTLAILAMGLLGSGLALRKRQK